MSIPAPLAPELGIHKVPRKVVDIRAASSQGYGPDYGYVWISLAHVSLIDGPREQTVEA